MTARHEQEPTTVQDIGEILRCPPGIRVDRYAKHLAKAIASLGLATRGCGKEIYYGAPDGENDVCSDAVGERLCVDCESNRDAAIRTLLGRTA